MERRGRKCAGIGSLNAGSREVAGRRNGDRRRRGGGGGCSGRPWQGRTLHWKASSTVAAVPPGPLQRPDQGVPEVLREQAVDIERDRVIDHFQQVSQGSKHLEMSVTRLFGILDEDEDSNDKRKVGRPSIPLRID